MTEGSRKGADPAYLEALFDSCSPDDFREQSRFSELTPEQRLD